MNEKTVCHQDRVNSVQLDQFRSISKSITFMKRKTAGNIIDLDDGSMILDPSVELHRAIDKY